MLTKLQNWKKALTTRSHFSLCKAFASNRRQMRNLKTLCIVTILALSLAREAVGAGIVAETRGGKLVLFEWNAHGTETPPVFESATLRIVDRTGEILYEEKFSKEHLSDYDEEKLEGGKYKVRLLIRGAKGVFDLWFNGATRKTESSEDVKEIDTLVKTLREQGRDLEPGSHLTVETPIGRFTFRDVICGIYGDV